MIGWWIVVSTQTPNERDRSDEDARRLGILAQWEAGAGGLRWVQQLAEQGKAQKLKGDGYPSRYTAKTRDVLPLIEGGGIQSPKDGVWIFGIDEGDEYVQPPGWMGKIELHPDRMGVCPAEHMLTIDAWDQS